METGEDLLLTGARVFTGVDGRHLAEALLVRGGRIAAVGGAEEVRAAAGGPVRSLDLSGCLVVAGFQDAHIHADHGGLVRTRCDLHEVHGAEACVAAVRAYAESHPDVPWILGGGWSLDDFPRGCPERDLLDAVVPNRPVYLTNRDGHDAWVNGEALRLAGVDAATPDPVDGRIERRTDGEPAGALHEGAMDLVGRHAPEPTGAEMEAALLAAQAHLHALGITAWQDAWTTEASLRAYRALARRGELTARVVAALWWDRARGVEQVPELLERRARGSLGRLRATSVKVMQDGIPENFTAGMIEPYLDDDGGPGVRRGLSFVDPEALKTVVTRLEREGFQVHVHAIGDRAVREALDAFEAARGANGPTDLRHHVAHLQVVHPDDVPRFGRLGVAANAQPYWAAFDGQMRDLVVPFLGPERTAWQYPFESLRRTGAVLALGSDWPVTTPNPLKILQVAATRVPEGEPEVEPLTPDERLDLSFAIRAYTAGSAFVNHLDGETGTLEAGKLADLAVVDRDLFAVDPMRIGEARVLLTLVEGEVVHADRGLDLP